MHNLLSFPLAVTTFKCNNGITLIRHHCLRCKEPIEPTAALYWGSYNSCPYDDILCQSCAWRRYESMGFWHERACANCQRAIYVTVRRLSNRRVFCDRACSDAFWAARARKGRAIERGTRSCPECLKTFTPKRTDSRYCSVACKQNAYRKRSFAPKSLALRSFDL